MGTTKIEWAERVWNPVTGCTKVSEGCRNCYAERMAWRLRGRAGYPAHEPFQATLHPDRLDEPLHWRKPSMVFVCSMGDLFHGDVPDEFIAQVWGVMRSSPQQIFLVLTKRPERMVRWVNRCHDAESMGWVTHDGTPPAKAYDGTGIVVGETRRWPLPNVWLGTSVENQNAANDRIPHLLQTPAAKRFVSCEPLLGAVDLVRWLPITYCGQTHYRLVEHEASDFGPMVFPDWVIVGGESGPGARPMHPDWARSLRDQCVAAGVPLFFKQWGEWSPEYPEGMSLAHRAQRYLDGQDFYRVGKKAAGRLLDGCEWNQTPPKGTS